MTEKKTGRRFACKTIPKVPKRGACTPRYLLKLQTEVDVMQQLGASLDSVHLKVSLPLSIITSPLFHSVKGIFLKGNQGLLDHELLERKEEDSVNKLRGH